MSNIKRMLDKFFPKDNDKNKNTGVIKLVKQVRSIQKNHIIKSYE